MPESLKYELGLFFTVIIWATSFIASDMMLKVMTTPQLLFLRFAIGSIAFAAVAAKRFRYFTKRTVLNGIILGVFVFLGFALQTYGLALSTPAKNAFLTGSYVIVVPFISFVIYKKQTRISHIIAAVLTMAGAAVLSLEPDFSINFGDVITLGGAFFYALQIFYVAEFSARYDIALMTAVQLLTCAVLSLLLLLLTGSAALPHLSGFNLLSVLHLGLICTAACFFLQMYFQKRIPETVATIIFSMEGPLAAIFSVCLGLEVLTQRLIGGSVMIFSAVLISQLGRGTGKNTQ